MMHPHTELRWVNNHIGRGVFATRPIPRGTITYVQDPLDIELTPEAFEALPEIVQEKSGDLFYVDARGTRILSWDIGRHVNHCCFANTISTGYGFEIAVRDIAADEEITDEYGLFNLPEPLPLSCPKEGCRGVVCAADLDTCADEWDRKVAGALALMRDVPQPLEALLEEDTRRMLDAYFAGGPLRSVRTLRYTR